MLTQIEITDTDTKLTNYLGSVQTEFTWHDGRYARACADGQGRG